MSAVFVYTLGDVVAALIISTIVLLVLFGRIITAIDALLSWFKYSRCAHKWRDTRGRRKTAYAESSWPTRTCDACGKVERT